ncbi:hypothetical protein Aduo_002485 [Ancylostoma duodenale]
MPSLCTRFLIFDQYLAFNDPERFCEYERLFPREFEDLYESIAPELGYGPSFVALAAVVERRCQTLRTKWLAIIKVLSSDAFPLGKTLTREMFEECASKTRSRYDYPRAVGILDGKSKKCLEFLCSVLKYLKNQWKNNRKGLL